MRAFLQDSRFSQTMSFSRSKLSTTTLSIQSVRNISRSRFDKATLGPCSEKYLWRPVFHRIPSTHGNVRGGAPDSSEKESLRNIRDYWPSECSHRLKASGINVSDTSGAGRLSGPIWRHAAVLRRACAWAYLQTFSPLMEIEARILCARIKDPRYPRIYHTLEDQAHTLYLLGRVELERDPAFHRLAWFMLSISAGLGHLDAALLLHQLEKTKSQFVVQNEQRAIITRAATEKLDWRAMVAHCEYTISKARGRSARGTLPKQDLKDCITLLTEAMNMTVLATGPPTERESPPEHLIDAETLETIDQPYKVLISLTNGELAAGNYSDEITTLYERATKVGALVYKDPEAAWLYAHWQLSNEREYTEDWVSAAEIAARDGNADACFQLAIYHLKRDGWVPSLTEVTLKAIRKQWHDDVNRMDRDESLEIKPLSDKQKHEAIMKQKNGKLLAAQTGLQWMKLAAQLHVDSATKMLNRYCIVAGLLRQNGFISEGKHVLLEVEEKLRDCVCDPKEISQAVDVLQDHLNHWDARLIQDQLRPEDINKLLYPPM